MHLLKNNYYRWIYIFRLYFVSGSTILRTGGRVRIYQKLHWNEV